jgi:hypothetical protein
MARDERTIRMAIERADTFFTANQGRKLPLHIVRKWIDDALDAHAMDYIDGEFRGYSPSEKLLLRQVIHAIEGERRKENTPKVERKRKLPKEVII